MIIHLEFFSILAQWVGASDVVVDLPSGATLGDLLTHIGSAYAADMPPQLWRRQEDAFVEQVGAFQNGVRVDRRTTPLRDGDVIRFMVMMGGG